MNFLIKYYKIEIDNMADARPTFRKTQPIQEVIKLIYKHYKEELERDQLNMARYTYSDFNSAIPAEFFKSINTSYIRDKVIQIFVEDKIPQSEAIMHLKTIVKFDLTIKPPSQQPDEIFTHIYNVYHTLVIKDKIPKGDAKQFYEAIKKVFIMLSGDKGSLRVYSRKTDPRYFPTRGYNLHDSKDRAQCRADLIIAPNYKSRHPEHCLVKLIDYYNTYNQGGGKNIDGLTSLIMDEIELSEKIYNTYLSNDVPDAGSGEMTSDRSSVSPRGKVLVPAIKVPTGTHTGGGKKTKSKRKHNTKSKSIRRNSKRKLKKSSKRLSKKAKNQRV